jgi:[glutamine synthetase] adenylyltransferase / [glutamine synthetase]-adenylyl-L-tyrosine phosphorylase
VVKRITSTLILFSTPHLHTFDTQLTHLFHGSRYAERVLTRHPEWRQWLASAIDTKATETVAALLAQIDVTALDQQLRHARQQAMLVILARDLNGLADFNEVATAISHFADGVVDIAYRAHQRALMTEYQISTSESDAHDLLVIGMGKLGGFELNVSSDIDLIFVYPTDGQANETKSWHEFHSQLGKRIIRTLDNVDDNGFVFRVDMRLRPYGASGPLVTSLVSLADYFVKQARPWERYAWLKARTITGVSNHRLALDKLIQPFVYRRYHDYAAIDDMRGLHTQIRAEATKRGKEDDIKVGVGGIREVEFIAQLHQLIRGGRDAALQTRSTREALQQLAKQNILPAATVDALNTAYHFLRNLEHRLQYLDDQQTQMLPTNIDDKARIAVAMGCKTWEDFFTRLSGHRAVVTTAFEDAFQRGDTQSNDVPIGVMLKPSISVRGELVEPHSPKQNQLLTTPPFDLLSANGASKVTPIIESAIPAAISSQNAPKTPVDIELFNFYDNAVQAEINTRHHTWCNSSRMANLSPKLSARLLTLIPRTIAAAAKVDTSQRTLFRLWDVIEAIDKRETYLALLIEFPEALTRLTRIAFKSAWAAEFVRRHPILLDELVSHASTTAINWTHERAQLQTACDAAHGDTERQYELLRHTKQIITLKLNIADIEGRISVMSVSDELSALADMLLDVTLVLAWRVLNPTLPNTWQAPQGFAILGYGKLGSKELGYASDLDLVFLYDDSIHEPQEKFAKLAQRLSSWLNTMTRGGVLYETDLRLRPDGAAGLLVSSLTAFHDYQMKRAWVWEHQALTRARWCAGDTALIAPIINIRNEILAQSRDRVTLKKDINDMREKMRVEKKDKLDSLNLKHTKGGIVDVEFIVQFIILAYASEHPELLKNLGNHALLTRAAALGILDEDLAANVGKAYLAYRERQHFARTNNELETWIGVEELVNERRAVGSAWGALLG